MVPTLWTPKAAAKFKNVGEKTASGALTMLNTTALLMPEIQSITVTLADPTWLTFVAVIVPVKCVESTKVVGRADPFQETAESAEKFCPFTVT